MQLVGLKEVMALVSRQGSGKGPQKWWGGIGQGFMISIEVQGDDILEIRVEGRKPHR